MADFIAVIDQGTTSTRCMIFRADGKVAGAAQEEHQQIYPHAGWVEHDALEIWMHTENVIRAAVGKAALSLNEIKGVGITNQRETTLVWNPKTGRPYGNAIVWQDTRTDDICRALSASGGQDRFRAKTGLPLATYFSGPKLKWILDNVDGVREAAQRGEAVFGTIDTWLIWLLTGGPNGGAFVTDPTNASRTLLMNLDTLQWDDELLAAMNIPRQMLADIRPSSDPRGYGLTQVDGPFGAAIPVCGDLGDQQAALAGQACFSAGEVKNTYGTGCFLLMNTGSRRVNSTCGLITTVAYQLANGEKAYALEGSVAIAGALVQWLRDNLKMIDSSSDIEMLAAAVEGNGGVYIVPAFSGLFAPYWRADARGVIVGLTRFANRGHIARAVLEAAAYQTRDVVEAMQKDSGVAISTLKVDGGMTVNDLLMQFQSDVLAVPVVCPAMAETTSLGAAYMAGLAVGLFAHLDDVRARWQLGSRWEPQLSKAEREGLYHGWKKAVERTFGWTE
jgi:glycerol kinase